VRQLASELELELKEKLNSFNNIYNEYLKRTLDNCRSARLNEDYYPIINGGTYREKSAIVPIRFMYYLSLLKLSLVRDDSMFPRFLIIDTPETAGIDIDNLLKCLIQIEDLNEYSAEFQIILTTGLGKFPESFKNNVKQTLPEGSFLLQLNT
jgi:hypothetical protein